MMQENRIEDIIARDGMYVSTVSGGSMKPMLVDRRDTVVISPPTGRLKKYDVVLYRSNGKYVLHRVVKVLPDSYVMCGDNCVLLEKGIRDEDVIGVLSEAWQGDRKLDLNSPRYRFYCRRRVAAFYPRKLFRRVRGIVASAFKKHKK